MLCSCGYDVDAERDTCGLPAGFDLVIQSVLLCECYGIKKLINYLEQN